MQKAFFAAGFCALALLARVLPAHSSESGSMSRSCSGRIHVCEPAGSCRSEYFYIYAYQYAYVYDGVLRNENHNINLSGVLSETPAILGVSGHWVIYQSGDFKLAIPWNTSNAIYARHKNAIDGPEHSGWQVLCPAD